jgi:type II secretory pathway component GspD/PulD (secretin)
LSLSAAAQANLDSTFGFRPFRTFAQSSSTTTPVLGAAGTNVILGPVTVTAVLHALYANTKAHEENAPMVITEDNMPSTVRVVTRTPIIVSTTTFTTSGTSISNDVRYLLDKGDPPNREIGTTLLVTPSILPDNTIRLQIDGTVATQVGSVSASTGSGSAPNFYPIVNEAHLVNLSRVPSGYSLILGGFVTIDNSVSKNKVPVLGDIPLLGSAFRYKTVARTRTNLAFIITPVAFEAGNPEQSVAVSERDRQVIVGPEGDLNDPALLGRVNQNATDYHNALSTGQFQESDKNPVSKPRKSVSKKLAAPVPQNESQNSD